MVSAARSDPRRDYDRDRRQPVIKITNGVKIFKESGGFMSANEKVVVLQDFNMSVPIGSLYSLLGSSGCGKTTVLSCIAGVHKLNSGRLQAFGNDVCRTSNQRIGFMPQDICLYQHFSIFETLIYFGTLFGLSKGTQDKKYLIERIQYMTTLLSLPPDSRIVGTLSGGQQRRVSLAVALVHEPELLLLDEMSSGLDPLVRELIWKHLKFLASSKGTTIILSTHYVEEAKDSDFVGIMRKGHLVAEENPTQLMEKYSVNSMESLFLKLCQEQDTPHARPRHPVPSNQVFDHHSDFGSLNSGYSENGQDNIEGTASARNSFRRIGALVDKNFKSMFRNIWMMLFITLDPAFTMFVICITFRNELRGISLGIVNNDIGRDAHCPNNSTLDAFCRTEDLSCVFLDNLSPDIINLKSYNTIGQARQAVVKGETWGFLYFPQNYTSGLINRVLIPAPLFEEEDESTFWNNSQIKVFMDQTNTLIYANTLSTLYETLETSSKTILRDCGYDERIGEYPLQYKKPISGPRITSSLSYIGPSMAIAVLYFFPSTVALRLIGEKRQGTMERSIVGGAKIWEILIGYTITEFAILVLQSVLIFTILHFGYSLVAYPSNIPLILAQCILQGLSGLTLGFLLAVICSAEAQAAIAIIASIMSNILLSGLIWPREGMPKILQSCSYAFPMTLPAETIRSLMTRGWGFEHPNVWPGFCISVTYIFGTAIVAALIISRNFGK